METLLKKIYFDPASPAGYSAHDKLYDHASKVNKSIKHKDVNEFLASQDSYTLFRGRRKKFPTARTVAPSVDFSWQTDLSDVSNLAEFNDDIKYILFCIDVYSRHLWAEPLINKESKTIANGFSTIFNKGRIPAYLVSDQGTEFKGSTKDYFNKLNVTQYTLRGPSKCGMIERVQKTIKSKVFKYLYAHNTKRYIDILPSIVESYNNSIHRIIKTTPTKKSKITEYKNIREYNSNCHEKNKKFGVGDFVRVSRQPYTFEKVYEGTFNIEIFQISRVLCRDGITVYYIKDLNNKAIKGIFYKSELQKVVYKKDQIFKIEKILSQKIVRGKKYYKVRWLGYGKDFDSFIPASDLYKP